jgi:hypothetical protein
LSMVLLFAIVFQSVHSFEHLVRQLSEKKCEHKLVSSHEITHQHHAFDHCFVCDFSFSNFVSNDFQCNNFNGNIISTRISFSNSKEIIQFFRGSLFALRAPPSFIV